MNCCNKVSLKPRNLRLLGVNRQTGVSFPQKFIWQPPPAPYSGDGLNEFKLVISNSQSVELWSSGWNPVNGRLQCTYRGEGLKPLTSYECRVIMRNRSGEESLWSDKYTFVTAPELPEVLSGIWLQPEQQKAEEALPRLKSNIPLNDLDPVEAYLIITSRGAYEATIDGEKVGEAHLSPGWTSYHHQHPYDVYDIHELVRSKNSVSMDILLADGWWRGDVDKSKNTYGDKLSVIFSLVLKTADGQCHCIKGDELDWQVQSESYIKHSSLYFGETWDISDNASENQLVENVLEKKDFGIANLVPAQIPFVKTTEVVQPVSVKALSDNRYLVDFGVNLVGVCELQLQQAENVEVVVRHAEVLVPGTDTIYTESLRRATQEDRLVIGERVSHFTFLPKFTFHGFRYAEIQFLGEGAKLLSKDDWQINAHFRHTDIHFTGEFSCSHPGINQLFKNIIRSQRGNFFDVPTDCPQRDERLGWTADTQVFTPLALLNADCKSFYEKYLTDLRSEQFADGKVPILVPNVPHGDSRKGNGSAGWGDAVALIPEALFNFYQDNQIWQDNYQTIRRWVEHCKTKTCSHNLIIDRKYHQYSDWLAIAEKRGLFPYPVADKDFIATAFFAKSTAILVRAARCLGYEEDVEHYQQLFDQITTDIENEFITPSGRIGSNSQANYVLALAFGLLKEELVPQAVQNLLTAVEEMDNHLSTGFLATPYLLKTLADYGHGDVACKIMLQEDWPSWLYQVNQGATTIWERWNGIKEDGSFEDKGMNSFNHYAFGIVGLWFYHYILGARPVKDCYSELLFSPIFHPGMDHARGGFETLYGRVNVEWHLREDSLIYKFTVPFGVRAKLQLPESFEIVEFDHSEELLVAGDYRVVAKKVIQ